MKTGRIFLGAGMAAVVVYFFSGCAALLPPVADSTRLYVMDVVDYEPVSEVEPDDEGAVVNLARVRVARYLEDAGITVRERGTRVVYSQQHRWAEPLEYGLARLVTENLNREPAVSRVVSPPAQRRPLPDFDLHVSIRRAEGVREAEDEAYAVFHADWELRAGVEGEVVTRGEVRANRLPWDGQNYEQLTGSISQGVVELTQDVARALEKM